MVNPILTKTQYRAFYDVLRIRGTKMYNQDTNNAVHPKMTIQAHRIGQLNSKFRKQQITV